MAKPITPTVVTEEVVEEIVEETVEVVVPAGSYVAVDGDSYASIADKFKPAKMTKHDYAVELFEKNAGKSLADGIIINL